MNPLAEALRNRSGPLLAELEGIYKDLHQHPELSMQEVRTAGIAADYLEALGYEVARDIGVTGVVGVLRNGTGATVMLRADMDALPMAENTGLPYASTVRAADEDGAEVGVAHSCGHDLHVTWLMGAARVLAEHRDAWTGTVLVVFQPGEEVGRGASSMVADWDDAALSPAGHHPGATRHGGGQRYRELPAGRHPVGGRQPEDPAFRTRLAWHAAADVHRPGHHGRVHDAAPADHRFARDLTHGQRVAHHRVGAHKALLHGTTPSWPSSWGW